MKRDAESLLAEALKLPAEARADIAGKLLKSLDDQEDNPMEVQAAWEAEIERRKEDLKSGAVKAMTADESIQFVASDDPQSDDR